MKRNKQQAIAVAIAAALASLAAGSASALEVYNDKGWKLDISGSMNAFYTSSKTDNAERSSSIENGLLPGYLNFTASTQQKGWDVKGVMGFWPGINSDSPVFDSATAGVGKSHTDGRTNYLSFGKADVGTFKLGRDIGMFQSNAILNDMTLLGVGGGAGGARNVNTTLGGIGAGYIYAEFQPQITYTSPKLGPLTLNVGMYDNKDIDASGAAGKSNGFQGLAEVGFESGKAWAGFVHQKFTLVRDATASGFELGGKVDVGPVGLMAQGFSGKGIGDTILFSGGFDAADQKRKSNGYLVQATYKIGDLKLGANVGESRTKGTAGEGGGDINRVQGRTLGAYYNLTPSVTLVGEFNQRKNKLNDLDTDTVSAGAILFF